MVYNELLFFLGLMPVTVLVSFLDRSAEYKNLILILTSVIFISWGRPMTVCLLFLSFIADYLIGLGISRFERAGLPLLLLDLAVNVSALLIFSHGCIFPEGSALSLSSAFIPVGAAFYTAKNFSYCFDVYTGRCKAERNIFCLMTYSVSYHFLLAGPVVRYGDVEPYIRKRSVTGKSLNDGLTRFIIGLGKTVILAQAFARLKQAGLEHKDITLAGSWIGMISFFAECWFSFSGLCDMAKGLGLMNGFEYKDNYRELSVGELIGGFLKSANTTLIELFTDVCRALSMGNAGVYAFLLGICCPLAALWYRISKPYLAVGIALGVIVLLEQLFFKRFAEAIPVLVKAVYVLLVSGLLLGGIYFTKLEDYKTWIHSLFGTGNQYTLSIALENALAGNIWLIVIAFFAACAPAKKLVLKGIERLEKSSEQGMAVSRLTKTILTAAVLVACVITLAAEAV